MVNVRVMLGTTLCRDSVFLKKLDVIVWNMHIEPGEFERSWNEIIDECDLEQNKWMSDMYDMRFSWIPAFFRDIHMGGLLRTTSRSESENSFFGCFLHPGMNLTEFFLAFESAMESQRQKKDRLDHESQSTYPPLKMSLAIEKHAECNCKNFQRIGILRRHILLALNAEDVNEIPEYFVMRRWTKYAAHKPAALSYNDLAGPDSADTVKAKLNMLYMQFNLIMKTHGSNIEYISELLDMLQEFNKRHDAQTTQLSKHAMFERLIGCSKPSSIEVQTPKQSRNKGCGKRMKSTKEKMTEQASKPLCKCNLCKQMVRHDIRNCPEWKLA
uniref:Protein FAR1-RELATED SEQUENCE n=1 Tax=Kalanchoe fedtschenkoi TaxID=63787 RepID=A0A7N1A8X5_KALFE